MSFLTKTMAGIFGGSTSPGSHDFWLLRAAAPSTHAGTFVSEYTAMNLPAVYSCVGIISDAVAQLPVEMAERKGNRITKVTQSDVGEMVANEPNPLMTAFIWEQSIQSHALLWGNGYADIERNRRGDPLALWPLLPDRTFPERVREDGAGMIKYRTTVDGEQALIRPENILHIPALGFDGIVGHSPIWMARQAVGMALALEEFGAKFFKHDAKSGGFLEYPGRLSDTAKKNIRDSLESQGGLEDSHRVKILEEGSKFVQTTIPPEDAQFLGTREFQLGEIARIYRVPLHMIGSQERSTSWGTGIESMSLGFLKYTLTPWLVRWEQELDRKLLTEAERKRGLHFRHNAEELLRGDAVTRSEFYTRALDPLTGWMERDEVRAREDLPPSKKPTGQIITAPPTPRRVPQEDE